MLRLRLGVAVEALTRFAAFRRVVGVKSAGRARLLV